MNLTAHLAHTRFALTHPHNRHPPLICFATRPLSQRWHSSSQTLNRLKKVISNFTETLLQKIFSLTPSTLTLKDVLCFSPVISEPSKLILGRKSLQIKIKNKNRKIIFYMCIYLYLSLYIFILIGILQHLKIILEMNFGILLLTTPKSTMI